MRFSVLASLVPAIAAFQIPDGQLDGIYAVSYGDDGQETHTRVSDLDTAKRNFAIRGTAVEKRGGAVTCLRNEGFLNQNDNGAAATALANQCGAGSAVGESRDFYSIQGCSVAYFCNHLSGIAICTSDEAWSSFNSINNQCGTNVPGYDLWYTGSGDDFKQYGYEWFCSSPGNKFCNRGTNGRR
jgi:hypothetical protein